MFFLTPNNLLLSLISNVYTFSNPLQVVDNNSSSLVTPRLTRSQNCPPKTPPLPNRASCVPGFCLNGGKCSPPGYPKMSVQFGFIFRISLRFINLSLIFFKVSQKTQSYPKISVQFGFIFRISLQFLNLSLLFFQSQLDSIFI